MNCISKTSFIDQNEFYNITFYNNTFTNNAGNLFTINYGNLTFISNTIQNHTCFYLSGCLFNLNKLSFLNASHNTFINISTTVDGGLIYLENSILMINGLYVSKLRTLLYASCIIAVKSHININGFQGYDFNKGCMEFTNIYTKNSIYQSTFVQEPVKTDLCYSAICVIECSDFIMNGSRFIGNYNNSLKGGV